MGCAPSHFRHGRLRWCEWVGSDRREALVSPVASSRVENERGRDLAWGDVYHFQRLESKLSRLLKCLSTRNLSFPKKGNFF